MFRHAPDCGVVRGAHDSSEDAGPSSDAGAFGEAAESAAANAVDWNTQFVTLHADDFRIRVPGKEFLGQSPDVSLHSDPGTADAYTTFEGIWAENGVEMRLFIYFHSDAKDWWASEIRVYDGRPRGEWLTATGEWFRRPLGEAFTGDFDLTLDADCCSAVEQNNGPGRLTMHRLAVQASLTPPACLRQNDGYVMEVLYPIIEMTTAPNVGFGAAVRLRDRNCKPVTDISDFAITWRADDPAIVELSTPIAPTNAQLRGLAAGKTALHVAAKRRSDGTAVAEGSMTVIVTSAMAQ